MSRHLSEMHTAVEHPYKVNDQEDCRHRWRRPHRLLLRPPHSSPQILRRSESFFLNLYLEPPDPRVQLFLEPDHSVIAAVLGAKVQKVSNSRLLSEDQILVSSAKRQ